MAAFVHQSGQGAQVMNGLDTGALMIEIVEPEKIDPEETAIVDAAAAENDDAAENDAEEEKDGDEADKATEEEDPMRIQVVPGGVKCYADVTYAEIFKALDAHYAQTLEAGMSQTGLGNSLTLKTNVKWIRLNGVDVDRSAKVQAGAHRMFKQNSMGGPIGCLMMCTVA